VSEDNKPSTIRVEDDTYRLYWQVQYDRIAQHEHGRYQVSAFVVTGSLVALGFVTQPASQSSQQWVATAAIALVNVLAILFIGGGRRWMKVHQDRAAAVLEMLSPDLVRMQGDVNRCRGVPEMASDRNSLVRSENLLGGMHALLVLATVVLAFTG
jgi:hypothetical protein